MAIDLDATKRSIENDDPEWSKCFFHYTQSISFDL